MPAAPAGPMGARVPRTVFIPVGALVVTVGAAGSGKSTFVRRFPPDWIVNPDHIRFEVTGDAANHGQEARVWGRAFGRIKGRLARGRTTVLDSTAATPSARRSALRVAQRLGAVVVLLVFDTPLELCLERNRRRHDPERSEPVPEAVVRQQHAHVQHFLQASPLASQEYVVVIRPGDDVHLEIEAVDQ